MGFFDNLIGLFTGDPAKKQAEASRAQMQQMTNQIANLTGGRLESGIGGLESGFGAGREALTTGFGEASDIINQFYPQALGAITGYGEDALGALRSGVSGAANVLTDTSGQALDWLTNMGMGGINRLEEGIGRATSAYNPLDAIATTYGGRTTEASNALEDAMGLNGPEGIARSRAAFTASPAYDFNLTQGLDAINRARAARGELSGGNIDRDTQTYGSGLASREWDNYLRGLSEREGRYVGFEPQLASTAATGRAGAETAGAGAIAQLLSALGAGGANLLGTTGTQLAQLLSGGGLQEANLLRGIGGDVSGILSGAGGSLANLATGLGGGLAGLSGQQAMSEADLIKGLTGQQVGFTGQTVQPIADTYTQTAQAQLGGAKNFFDMLGNIATFGAKGFGWGGFGAPVKA